ncbi:helix-turn-helix domain-containing protein [Cronobacter turicensis]|nr:helix-turn-helix domain-containing protein [Cronobacter turicensis]
MKELDIGEVARQTALPPSTLRFYEKKGLIRAIGRKGLRRQYSERVLEQLALIALARAGGFTLDEISAMFNDNGVATIDRQALLTRADEIDSMLRQLTSVRDGLRHIAGCTAPDHLQCPTFRQILARAHRFAPLTFGKPGSAVLTPGGRE